MTTDSDSDRYLTNAADIFSVFRVLQTDRSAINLQFGKSGQLYNTLILDVGLRQRLVSFDEITPGAGHDRAVKGEPFNLRASINGIRVYVPEMRISKVLNDESGIYYHAAFPDRLMYQQRRDAFRAVVPGRLDVKAQCGFTDRKSVMANTLNLSATGIRLSITGKMVPPPAMMEKFKLTLTLPAPDGAVSLIAEVVHESFDKSRNCTVLGCRFSDINRNEQIIINRFVTRLQREALT